MSEHVEVVAEAPGAVEPPAGSGDLVQLVAAAKVLGALRLPSMNSSTSTLSSGRYADHPGPDAGVGGRDRVQVLVLPVDREQAGVLGGDPDDVGA